MVPITRFKGIVTKSTGSWYMVSDASQQTYPCRLRGKFKMAGIKSTNPVVVGDHVEVELDISKKEGMIDVIHERHNYIVRKSTNLSKQTHIIAANIDALYLLVTIAEPRTSTGFIDRYIATAEAYHIPTTLLFNKTDIYTPKDIEKMEELMAVYQAMGYPCYRISALHRTSIDHINQLIGQQTILFSGHSGVGKSTLLNALVPQAQSKTGAISNKHSKGMHITTFAEMFSTEQGGYIIDTPGIKEFGLVDMDKWELSHYFNEMNAFLPHCQFANCTHTHEPGCAVKQAVAELKIAPWRYENYINMYNDI